MAPTYNTALGGFERYDQQLRAVKPNNQFNYNTEQNPQIYKNYYKELMNYPHMQAMERTKAAQDIETAIKLKIQNGQLPPNSLMNAQQAQQSGQMISPQMMQEQQDLENQIKHQLATEEINKGKFQQKQWQEKLAAEQQRLQQEAQQYAADQQRLKQYAAQNKVVQAPVKTVPIKKPRVFYSIPDNQPTIFRNIQNPMGVMNTFSAPFSTYGANHPYMRAEGGENHNKWYDPNNGKYYNTQF